MASGGQYRNQEGDQDQDLRRLGQGRSIAIGLMGLWCGAMLWPGAPALAQAAPDRPSSAIAQGTGGDTVVNSDLVKRTLQELPQPPHTNTQAASLTFAPGAYGQQLLNVETVAGVEEMVAFYRASLTQLGYQERLANASVTATGFSLVFEIPPSLEMLPTQTTPTAVFQIDDQLTVYGSQPAVRLVLQGTMLEPGRISTGIRFQEL